ncbi:FAD-dependent monooxygenase [Streptomyces rubiginosohelvolus]|uniref:FAD-dependent monooxygenase n=1 Tax=Streptomyces rubiginosohelvolus TaxID=67362 RepID=UPI0035DD3122
MDTQVIIVGAGPVGLLLAGELRLGGAEVVVVDKLARPTTESRASTVHARTMELLDQRELLAELGTPPREPRGHFGGIPLDLGRLTGPYPGIWKVPQTTLEELLGRWATGLGARLLRSVELTGLTDGPDGVEAGFTGPEGPLRMRASALVGCDGERSTVRELAGIAFPGFAATREMLRADIAGIDIPARRFERLPGGLAVSARRPDGVTRVMVHRYGAPPRPRSEEPSFAEIAEAWQAVTGERIGDGEVLWRNAFDDTCRQAERYRAGRILLAGDAAHAQMPVGGQALNLGLQDAWNLGWKLAATVTGRAPDALLDTYHEERHPVGARVLESIRAQTHVLLGDRSVEPVRTLLGELLAQDAVRDRLAAGVSGVDVRYDVGGAPGSSLGARVPPSPLHTDAGPTSTAALLRDGRGLLVELTPAPASAAPDGVRERTAPWAGRVRYVRATAPAGSPLRAPSAPAVLLLRPDGHVAWAHTEDGPSLTAALHRWFGTPRPSTGDDHT